MLALIQTLVLALDLYWWIIIASAIFSWLYAFNVVNPRNQFVGTIGNMLFRLTEPALRPIRRFMPDLGGIDISPIILLLAHLFRPPVLCSTTVAPLVSDRPLRWLLLPMREDGLDLFVRLTPNAPATRSSSVEATADGRAHLSARVRAVPEKGAANARSNGFWRNGRPAEKRSQTSFPVQRRG